MTAARSGLSFRPLAKGPYSRIDIYSGSHRVGEIFPPAKHAKWHWRFAWVIAGGFETYGFADSEIEAKRAASINWQSFLDAARLVPSLRVDPEIDDVERLVLGALFLDSKHAVDYVIDLLPQHFQTEAHRNIYAVMRGLITINVDLSTITLKPFLEGMSDGKGGNAFTYLSICASRIVLKDRLDDFVRVITTAHNERELLNA
nr:MAG TPA: Replicative DNA helicase [Caudoviricetes sp.]